MTNVPFSDLIQNGKFIGDLAAGLLSEDRFPASVQPRAVEYQALTLLAHEKGIAVKPLKTRAELEDALKIDAPALAAAVARVGKDKMPFEVPRFGDVLSYEGADLVPGEKWALEKDVMDNLLLAQTAGRVMVGIVPAFAPRFDEAKDPADLVTMQKALVALKESSAPVPESTRETAKTTLETIYTQLGGTAYSSIGAFMEEIKNPIPFSDLIQNGKFIGDMAVGLLSEDRLPASVQKRAFEYQALTLLAHEKGIAVKPLKTRAELEDELKLEEGALAAAVKRIGKDEMPREVPRFGDILTHVGADLVPGESWVLDQETMNDLLMLQSAGRVAAGIVPAFAPRFDEAKDDPNLVILQKALIALKDGTPISKELKTGARKVLALTAEQIGFMAQNKVTAFTRDLSSEEKEAKTEKSALKADIIDRAVNQWKNYWFRKDLSKLEKKTQAAWTAIQDNKQFRNEFPEYAKKFDQIDHRTDEGRTEIAAMKNEEARLYERYRKIKSRELAKRIDILMTAHHGSARGQIFFDSFAKFPVELGGFTAADKADEVTEQLRDFMKTIKNAQKNGFDHIAAEKALKEGRPVSEAVVEPKAEKPAEAASTDGEKKAEKKKRAWYNIPGRIIDGMFEKKFRNDLDKLYDVAVAKEKAEAALGRFRNAHPAFKDLDPANAEQVKALSDEDKVLLKDYGKLYNKDASLGAKLQKTAAKRSAKAREFYAEAGKTTIKEPIKVPAGEFIDAIERAKAESYGPNKPNFLQRIYNRLVPAKQEKVRQEPVLKTDEAPAEAIAEKPAEATAPPHVRDPQHPEAWASRLPERPDTPVVQPTIVQPLSAAAQPVAQPPVAPVTATAPAAPVIPAAAPAAEQPVALTARQKLDAYWDNYKSNLDRLFAAEAAEKELKEKLAETRKRVKPEIEEAKELAQLEKDIAEQAHEISRDDLAVYQRDLRTAKGLHRKGQLTTAELKEWVEAVRAAEDISFEKLEALEAAEEKLKTSHLSPELESLKAAYKTAKREVVEANTVLGVTTPKTRKDNSLKNLKGSWSKQDWAIAQREWKGQPHNRPETPRQRAAFDAAQKPKLANG